MSVNRGKDFEEAIKFGFRGIKGVSLDRIPDPMAGFMGVRNIADFCVYQYPYQYYFECKAVGKNTLNFKSGITENQWRGLFEKSRIHGVIAGFLVWFIDHDITVFVSIQELYRLNTFGAKSLNIKDIKSGKVSYYKVPAKKKRVLYTYDGAELLQALKDGYDWNTKRRGEV